MSDDPRAELPVPNRRAAGGAQRAPAPPRDFVEPSVVFEPPPPSRRRLGGDPAMHKDLGLVLFVLGAIAIGVVTWNLAGTVTGGALAPGSAAPLAVAGSASPDAIPSHVPTPSSLSAAPGSAAPSGEPASTPVPTATPTPRPQRRPVKVRIETRPAAVFASEHKETWCAAAAVQIALNVNGPDRRIDTSVARQRTIRDLEVQLTTRKDSRNGGVGPLGMVATLERLGKVSYRLRSFPTRAAALRAAAVAVGDTGHAAILLAWRGAHAWVMTGYRADADPGVFANAKVTGAYIIDPWYPRVSSIWGPSDKPGVYQDRAEMRRNFLPWKRPEGRYPGRDGRFLVILPTS